MRTEQKIWIGLAAGVVIILAVSFLGINKNAAGKYDDFAKCLSEKGVKMYGAFWCPHCQEQKNEFGDSWKYVNYIECSTPDRSQTDVCRKAGIKAYPTWELSDGKRYEGRLSFENLSQESNCLLGG